MMKNEVQCGESKLVGNFHLSFPTPHFASIIENFFSVLTDKFSLSSAIDNSTPKNHKIQYPSRRLNSDCNNNNNNKQLYLFYRNLINQSQKKR